MFDDLRTALRSLRGSPTFRTVALTVLALGIGAGTAIFSVVDAVVLRGLPFDEHDRIVAVLEHDTRRPDTFGGGRTTAQTYLDWRRLQESFEAIAGVESGGPLQSRSETGEPVESQGLRVTHEFFTVFRVQPILGRAFTEDDSIEGRNRVAIISYGYWLRRFGGSPDAIGKTIEVSDQDTEIVGVMPRGFTYSVAVEKPTEIAARRPQRGRTSGQRRAGAPRRVGRSLDRAPARMSGIRSGESALRSHPARPAW